jgi:hypothetical protein
MPAAACVRGEPPGAAAMVVVFWYIGGFGKQQQDKAWPRSRNVSID